MMLFSLIKKIIEKIAPAICIRVIDDKESPIPITYFSIILYEIRQKYF